jgi:hypothetical protein
VIIQSVIYLKYPDLSICYTAGSEKWLAVPMEELEMRELTWVELDDATGGQMIDQPDWANLPTPRPDTTSHPPSPPTPWFPPENYRQKR